MPSDPRALEALELLAEPIDRFRSAVAATLEDVRGELAGYRSDARGRTEQLKEQLGPFASGRVDFGRLASVLGSGHAPQAGAQARLEAAYEALQDIARRGSELFYVTVPAGTDVCVTIAAQLGLIGRAFGAARVAAAVRGTTGTLHMEDEKALTRFPFTEWNLGERRLAPPLVVTVPGRELNAAGLARFLDGAVKIVLLVEGPCAPAPLVRLITPNVFVIQAHELTELQALANWPGTAIGALMPPTGGRFVHDPSAGPELWQRLIVGHGRDGRLARIGGISAAQQNEELLQLEALSTQPAVVSATGVTAGSVGIDPAERLAAWLLQQANLGPDSAWPARAPEGRVEG